VVLISLDTQQLKGGCAKSCWADRELLRAGVLYQGTTLVGPFASQQKSGFSRCVLPFVIAITPGRSLEGLTQAGAKSPNLTPSFMARLKSCPDTKPIAPDLSLNAGWPVLTIAKISNLDRSGVCRR
jgi:hypothetical protein